ncbi:MAG: hypothetical protein ACP5GR_05915 [Thermoplasmata archaeon]|jgi:hypothetical protein
MQKRSFIYRIIENIIKKINGIENLPEVPELERNIKELDLKIKKLLSGNKGYSEIAEDYEKLMNLEEELALRKRIDASVSTLFYFVYTIAGSIVGLAFSIAIFLTTRGSIGHILILFSMAGNIISITIGIMSMSRERNYTKDIVDDLKKRIIE